MIRILIADDHRMFIDGIEALLKDDARMCIAGNAGNGAALLSVMENTAADLVIMDVNMDIMNGIEATKEIKKKYPAVKVLALTMFSSRDQVEKVLRAGADGYILKNTGKEELTEAIEKIMSGESYFSKEVTQNIMQYMQRKKQGTAAPSMDITPREKEVLRLIVDECTSQEIADKLCISFHTVETHRKNLISKLQVKSTAGLVRFAMENGLVD